MIGMRNRVMPGARILKIVTRKLTAPRIELVPMRTIATIQRSWPGPIDAEWTVLRRAGCSDVQPAAAARR